MAFRLLRKGAFLKIWIVNVNEPLPTDQGNDRPWRMGAFFDVLRQRGHDVTWWSSTMHHFDKRQRFDETTEVSLDERSRVIHLHGCIYRRNISLQRLRNHRTLGTEFKRLAPAQDRPDIILASIPILDLPREAVRFGRPRGIPVVIDVRDKWPDFMVDQVPGSAKPLARILLKPLFRDLKEACSGAHSIVGVTPGFVSWGVEHAGRAPMPTDRYFPHGYPEMEVGPEDWASAEQFWDDQGIKKDNPAFTLCFIGSLNFTAFDFSTLVEGMKILGDRAQLVVCGSGVGLDKFRQLASQAPNIIMPGWVDSPQLQVVMARSQAGVAPYRNLNNFEDNLPNKFLEYLSQDLPVISCLDGFSRQVLEGARVARFYSENNPESFARQVQQLSEDSSEREAMARRAGELFRSQFRAEDVYGKLADHLEAIVESAPSE